MYQNDSQTIKIGGGLLSIKDAKVDFIVDVSKELFLQNGIASVTIKDIAKSAGVGEATIYRYFNKKQNIIIAVALKLEKEVLSNFGTFNKARCGYDKLVYFYNCFLDIFNKRLDYLRFVSEFDSIFSKEEDKALDEYEKNIFSFYEIYIKAYEEGLMDNSVRVQPDIELFYFSTTHALLGLCKKLAYEKEILNQDLSIDPRKEIISLIDIILFNLRNL